MRVRAWMGAALVAVLVSTTGCGGDPIELCEGCGTPTPTPTFTPEATPTVTSTPASSTSPGTSPSASTSPGSAT